MQDSFTKAAHHRTYRLENKSQRYDSKILSKVAKLVNKRRSQLNETDFDEMDPISILAILKEFTDPCDSIGIHEGVATLLFPCFKKMPVSSSLEAQLSPKKRHVKGLHDELLSSYVEVVNFPLATYVTDDIIARAIKELESYRQPPRVSAAICAKRLYTKTFHFGIFYEEKRVKCLFVEGLDELVCDNMRVYFG